MKSEYFSPEFEVVKLEKEDVVMTSPPVQDVTNPDPGINLPEQPIE